MRMGLLRGAYGSPATLALPSCCATVGGGHRQGPTPREDRGVLERAAGEAD